MIEYIYEIRKDYNIYVNKNRILVISYEISKRHDFVMELRTCILSNFLTLKLIWMAPLKLSSVKSFDYNHTVIES